MKLARPLLAALLAAGPCLAPPAAAKAPAKSSLAEIPRKVGVGQPLQLHTLKPPPTEEIQIMGGKRTILHNYQVLYGGKTLESGQPTVVLHLSHRIEIYFEPGDQGSRKKKSRPTPQVSIDHEVTSYDFVAPTEISIGGASLLVLSYDDQTLEFVEN